MEKRIEEKKTHWKQIKDEFISLIPKEFNLTVEGLEDIDKYYHPIINVNKDIFIKCQCDLGTKYVYGMGIHIRHFNSDMFYLSIEKEQLNFILSNWNKVKDRIFKTLELTKTFFEMKELLDKSQHNIMHNAISKIQDKEKMKQVKDNIFRITEFIENNRLTY